MKIISIDGLTKFVGGMHEHFQKAASHHAEMHGLHKGHAAEHEAQATALDEGDVHKAFHTKAAAFHTAAASLHKVHGEHCTACMKTMDDDMKKMFVDEAAPVPAPVITKCTHDKLMTDACTDCKREITKAAVTDPKPGEGLEIMVASAVNAVTAKALGELNNNPEIEKMVQKMVVDRVAQLLGNQVVPDGVRGAIPAGMNLVPRPGAPDPSVFKAVDPELQCLVEM